MYNEEEKDKISKYMVKISEEIELNLSKEFNSFTEQEKVMSERHLFAFKKMQKAAELERKNNYL
jgi:hypothetical protein